MSHSSTREMSRRKLLAGTGALCLAGIGGAQAQAQAWPTKTVTMVVPWPAGNPTDGLTRKMQPLLIKAFGQNMVVENLPGAGGTLGVAKVYNQAPDGYTVLVGTPTELILSPLTIPSVKYGPADFRMVGLWGRVPYILVARPDLPFATLADLLASKNKPGTKPLAVGNIGPGSLIHLLGVQFARVTGLEAIQVNFQGVPPLVQNLLGSQVDLGFIPINGSTMALIEQGKLRSLGITAPEPFPVFPSLKPLAAGSPVFAGFNYDVWGGMHVHKSVPLEVQQRLNQVFYEVCRDPDFREYARSTGSALLPPMNLAELDKMYVADTLRYQTLSKSVPL